MKDFDEFEKRWNNELGELDRAELTALMSERYDQMFPDKPEDRHIVVSMWVEQRMPLRMLRRYHEWSQG